MKPIRPYPGHRGKKPARPVTRSDVAQQLGAWQPYNSGLRNQLNSQTLAGQSSYWSACSQYNANVFNAWPSAPASVELDRPDTEQSSGSMALQSTAPEALVAPFAVAGLAKIRAGFSEILALTSRVFCRDRKGS